MTIRVIRKARSRIEIAMSEADALGLIQDLARALYLRKQGDNSLFCEQSNHESHEDGLKTASFPGLLDFRIE